MKHCLLQPAVLLLMVGGLSAAEEPAVSTNEAARIYRIDLPTALRLVLEQNHQVKLAEQRVTQARARQRLAQYQLIPTLRFGANYYYQDGPLQDTGGTIQNVTRSGAYAGLGAGAVGAGFTTRPGLSLEADLARAIYEPLAAKQARLAAEAGSDAVRQQQSLAAVEALYELMRAKSRLAVAEDALRMHAALADLTASFAASGAGLQSDAERAAVEKLLARSRLAEARQTLRTASVKLARLLRINPEVRLFPVDDLAPVEWFKDDQAGPGLVALALSNRPELRVGQALVAEAQQRARQTKYAPLIPKVALGISVGGFGGDTSASPDGLDGRTDFGGAVFWELEGLGLGNHQRHRERAAQLETARIRQDDWEQRVRAEVAVTLARVQTTREQVRLTRTATESAVRSYEANRSLAFEQKALPIETLQAIHSLTAARQEYVDALAAQNVAQFALYTALGQPASLGAPAAGEPAAE